MGVLNKKQNIGDKLQQFLEKQEISSEKELNKKLTTFFQEYNQKMDNINRQLGDGIGKFIGRAWYLLEKQKYQEAINVCTKILRAHQECEEALLIKAEAHLNRGELDEADVDLKKLEKINSLNPLIYFFRAQVCIHRGMESTVEQSKNYFEKALKHINKALKIDPENFDLLMCKAQVLYWQGDERYQVLIQECSRIDKMRTNLFMKNSWIEEIPAGHPLAILNTSMDTINNLMSKSKSSEAIKLINKITQMNMERGIREVLYSLKIECLIGLREDEKADGTIQELLILNKNYPMPYFHRAVIKFNNHQLQEALLDLDECIKVAEKVNLRHWQYYQLKSEILEKLGDSSYKELRNFAEEIRRENKKKIKAFMMDLND